MINEANKQQARPAGERKVNDDQISGLPWLHTVCKERGPIVTEQDGELVALCGPWDYRHTTEQAEARSKRNLANARRIVACVNAFEGIDTETIEKLRTLENFIRRVHVEVNSSLARKFNAAEQQRDALLAALEAMAICYPNPVPTAAAEDREHQRRVLAQALAAIAAAKAGTV